MNVDNIKALKVKSPDLTKEVKKRRTASCSVLLYERDLWFIFLIIILSSQQIILEQRMNGGWIYESGKPVWYEDVIISFPH